MMFNPNFKPRSQRSSMGIALIFLLIALAGMILIYVGPEKSDSNPPSEITGEKTASPASGATLKTYVIRTVLVTGIIILIIVTGSRIFRQRTGRDISGQLPLNIIGRKYIGPKQSLLIVLVGGKQLLLGVTDSSIQLLTDLTDEEFEYRQESNVGQGSFRQVLQRFKKSDSTDIP
jgi:flagellar biogenesis protein FliO